MRNKMFLYLVVLFLSTLLLTGCTKKEEVVEEENPDSVVKEDSGEEEKVVIEKEDLGYVSNPEDFKNEKQVFGQSNEFEYTVESIKDGSQSGYHDFEFVISSTEEGATTPFFTVEPVLTKGVVRVTIKNVVGDNSDITHTKGIVVEKGAITGISRIVTSLENTRIYEIGVLASNGFFVEQTQDSDGTWIFSVKVEYDSEYTKPTVDYGSTDFSSDEQSIEGMVSADGAKITTYSYSVSGGVLRFVFDVASGASNPIPSVSASYDSGNSLVVTFESLASDKVSTWGKSIALPGWVSIAVSRTGESSVYQFNGVSGAKPFKLSATQSPNQVIVEIKL
ncbi:hypothetical protein A3K02_01615 [candidate division WS6 bacterium RIFOXYD1_FULL_33_8]|nr:MAG: hypothetical protein A3K02_01615 [candidate division WS6 bacterium RIFOXYD1_FULL_33_8]